MAIFQVEANSILLVHKRLKMCLPISFDDREDHFLGNSIGNPESVTKGKNTTAFHMKSFRTKPAIYFGITHRIDLGLKIDSRTSIATELCDLLKESPDIIADGTSIIVSGAGLSVRYNSRDSDTKPQQGIYITADAIYYKENLGKGRNFGFSTIEYRQYQPIIRKGSLLAWNIMAQVGIGDIPWTELACLGSTRISEVISLANTAINHRHLNS
jgi:hypothetical protein